MNSISYNFLINDAVWVTNNNAIVKCVVERITLEADPTSTGGVINKSTYHIHPVNTAFDILLRAPDELFNTLPDIMDYISSGVIPSPPSSTTINYKFAINELVWSVENDTPVLCNVIQITFDIDPKDQTSTIRTIYHLLPQGDKYSVILREDVTLFNTLDEANDYIIAKKMATVSPTPTPAPQPTPTPTPSLSGIDDAILDLDGEWMLDLNGNPITQA